jgi:hypothetical protein
MLGRRLTETYPYVPISGNMRISVGIRAGFDELVTATAT